MFRPSYPHLTRLILKPKIRESSLLPARYDVHSITYSTDAYAFHQPKVDKEFITSVLEDIQDAEKKNLVVKTKLETISNVYLQPLSTFAGAVAGIGKVCPFN